MKKLLMILPMVFLLCSTFGCQQGEEVTEEPAVDIAAEEAAIRETDAAMVKSAEAKDVDGMTSFLAEDFVSSGATNYGDKEGFHKFWTEQLSQEGAAVNWVTEKVVVADSGDLAYAMGTVENTRIVEGETRTNKATFLVVWQKQPDGNWKVVAM